MKIDWRGGKWGERIRKNALDGVEECVRTLMATQAREDCPVDKGVLRASIGVERNDAERCVYLGCGGAARKYALRQEVDRSLHHRVGKAGFIRDSVVMHAGKLPAYIKKHVG